METGKKTIPAFIGVACVWMGTHFGPGFASGAQMNIYYVKYGIFGLFMPLVAMLILGVSLYFTIEYSRIRNRHNFNDYVKDLYSPYQKVMAPLFDFCYLFTVVCALGACLASIGSLLEAFIGLPYWIGIGMIIAVILLMSIFGSEIVRILSSYMMFIVSGLILLIVIMAFATGTVDLEGALASSKENIPDQSFGKALWSAVIYASFQATIICNICSETDTLKNKSESKKSVVAGYIGNVVLMTLVIIMLFGVTNSYDVLGETLPLYSILDHIGYKWLTIVYLVLVVLAVASTGVGFIYSGIARFGKVVPVKNERARGAAIAIVLMVGCALAASFGLTALVSKGFTALGYLNLPIMIIPAIFVTTYKMRRFKGLPS